MITVPHTPHHSQSSDKIIPSTVVQLPWEHHEEHSCLPSSFPPLPFCLPPSLYWFNPEFAHLLNVYLNVHSHPQFLGLTHFLLLTEKTLKEHCLSEVRNVLVPQRNFFSSKFLTFPLCSVMLCQPKFSFGRNWKSGNKARYHCKVYNKPGPSR